MRILFFGSASIGFPVLEALLTRPQDHLVGVVTQPDRPGGRKLKTLRGPVKTFAHERNIPVFSPEKVGSPESIAQLGPLKADLFVVVAYGQYIPQSILALPPYRSINLHPSLLPQYRGSAPIQWALANGDTMTGVTILYVSEKMDAGDIIGQREVAIRPEDTAITMEPILGQVGAECLIEALDQIRLGTVVSKAQDEALATETHKLTKEDGRFNWALPARTLNNRLRGFISWPGCFFERASSRGASQRVKVLSARMEPGSGAPGEILDITNDGPLVATGEGALRLLKVQPAGKCAMTGAAYLLGHPIRPGEQLGINEN